MNTKDLAWKGVTAKEKTQLLESTLAEAKKFLVADKPKEYFLGIGSTCVDILHTTVAVRETKSWSPEWEKLEHRTKIILKDIVTDFKPTNTKNWKAGDFDVMATICLLNGTKKDFAEAASYLEAGIKAAVRQKDAKGKILLFAKTIKLDIAEKNIPQLKHDLRGLANIVGTTTDATVLTRVYRTLAEGSKFLAIEIATKAKLHNQVLKAKGI